MICKEPVGEAQVVCRELDRGIKWLFIDGAYYVDPKFYTEFCSEIGPLLSG